jgi:predicted NACHT family NTPase
VGRSTHLCTVHCHVLRGMTKQQFENIFERLTPRRKEVLLKFLANESDEAIANSLHITKATVRKTLEKICEQFGLKNDFPDERRSKRQDLVALFAKYKPELLGGCASVVENEGAIATPNAPVSQADESDLDALVEKVRSHPDFRDKIQDQCGSLRILDVEWLVGIDNIYIDVNVLEKLPSNRRLELSDFQRFNAARDHFDRLGLGRVSEPQVPGLEAVTRYSKLMVLGKPGAGKTTFLKSLAVQCIQDDFQKERIPTFIELKVFAEDAKLKVEFGLLNYINQELCVCDVSEQQVEKLLHQGRFLILLDGLDEVKADVGDKVLTEVSNFSRKYFRNQFVITCRIAAQLANQRDTLEFTDVEVADFDEEQIEAFAKKWFVAVARNSRKEGLTKAAQFIKKLQLPENQQIRELAVTPILLNLTCLVFQEKTAFPSKRAKLYEEGLDILLDRWDTSRRIQREEAYQNLSLEDKKDLLSQVAFITFERGDYFFEQDQIQQDIADYLRTLPDAQTEPRALKRDSKAVLKSIEAQHGLLIERARGIYSFSHLTFQEYFTARRFVDSADLQNLVDYITDKYWLEVFLLASGMMQPADALLCGMKKKIDLFLAYNEKLQNFLDWTNQKSLIFKDIHRKFKARLFYISLNIDFFIDIEVDKLSEFEIEDLEIESSSYIYLAHDLGLHLDLHLNSLLNEALTLISVFNGTLEVELHPDEIDNTALCIDQDLHRILDFEIEPGLKQRLQELKEQLPDWTDTWEIYYQEWWHAEGQSWTGKLRAAMVEYCNIGHDWQFSAQQKELLKQYYNANKLLVDCLNSGCDVSPEVRQQIEETLLLPKDDIDRRKAESNTISGS